MLRENIRQLIKYTLIISLFISSFMIAFFEISNYSSIILTNLIIIIIYVFFHGFKNLIMLIPLLIISFFPSDFSDFFLLDTTFGGIDYIIIVLIILNFLVVLLNLHKIEKVIYKNRKIYAMFMILTIYILITILTNAFSKVVVLSSIRFLSSSFLIFNLYTLLLYKHKNISIYLKLLLVTVAAVCVIGVAEIIVNFRPYYIYFQGIEHLQSINISEYMFAWRIRSSIGNPLILATFVLLSIPLNIYHIKNSNNKTLHLALLVLQVVTIILTTSRFPIILMTIYLLYEILHTNISIKKILFFSVASLAIIIALSFVFSYSNSELFFNRLFFRTAENSITHRIAAYKYFINVYISNPLIGIGMGNGYFYLMQNLSQTFVTPTFDNAFLDILVENGIIGFGIIIALVYQTINRIHKIENLKIKKIASSTIVLFLILGLNFNVFMYQASWAILWIYMSIYFSYQEEKKP